MPQLQAICTCVCFETPCPSSSRVPRASSRSCITGPASLRCWNRTDGAVFPAGMVKRALSAAPGHTHTTQRVQNHSWAPIAVHTLGGMVGARLAPNPSGLALSAVETSVPRMEHTWRYTSGFVQVFRRKTFQANPSQSGSGAAAHLTGPLSIPFSTKRALETLRGTETMTQDP